MEGRREGSKTKPQRNEQQNGRMCGWVSVEYGLWVQRNDTHALDGSCRSVICRGKSRRLGVK